MYTISCFLSNSLLETYNFPFRCLQWQFRCTCD